MIQELRFILGDAWQRLVQQILHLLPNVLAMLLILLAGWIVGRLAQWILHGMSARLNAKLRSWGISTWMDEYGRGGAAHLVARLAFWVFFGVSILMAINTLNTEIGSRLVTSAFLYLPRLVTAALIAVAGLLFGRYLARGALIWAVNEGIGPARWVAAGVRVGIGLLTFVAAAEQLAVAHTAVLATFIILLSGIVLAAALAVGLGARKRLEQWLDRRESFLEQEHLEHLEHL